MSYRFPLIYGVPKARGALALPINPAKANIVNTYGKINKKTLGTSLIIGIDPPTILNA